MVLLPLSLSTHEGEAIDNAGGGVSGGGGQWRWRAMVAAVFNGGGDGLRIGDVEAKMAIDANGGGWFEAKMVIDNSSVAGGDSGCHRLMAAMDEGGRSCLTVASVDNRYGVQWRWWRWHLMAEAAFDGVQWRRQWTTAS